MANGAGKIVSGQFYHTARELDILPRAGIKCPVVDALSQLLNKKTNDSNIGDNILVVVVAMGT